MLNKIKLNIYIQMSQKDMIHCVLLWWDFPPSGLL